MADSKANRGKVQDEPGILCSARKKNAQKIIGICQKYSGANVKGLPLAISGIKKIHNYNPQDKESKSPC